MVIDDPELAAIEGALNAVSEALGNVDPYSQGRAKLYLSERLGSEGRAMLTKLGPAPLPKPIPYLFTSRRFNKPRRRKKDAATEATPGEGGTTE